jgi:hypothetical protein
LAGGAALGSVALDHAIGSGWVQSIGWVWSGGADGARGVLSVVAGSVMTVVSIVFSLTVTTLAQTSLHYGPRVLRNFTSDRFVQFTLGTFVSTFVYCLLVLRTVRSVEESSFVPYVSVNLGVLLALASLAVLKSARIFKRRCPFSFPSASDSRKTRLQVLAAHRSKASGNSRAWWNRAMPVTCSAWTTNS